MEVHLTGIELDTDTDMWQLSFEKKLSLKSRIKIFWHKLFRTNKADILYEKVDMCYEEDNDGEIKNLFLMTKDGKKIGLYDLQKIGEMDINS